MYQWTLDKHVKSHCAIRDTNPRSPPKRLSRSLALGQDDQLPIHTHSRCGSDAAAVSDAAAPVLGVKLVKLQRLARVVTRGSERMLPGRESTRKAQSPGAARSRDSTMLGPAMNAISCDWLRLKLWR